MTGRNPLSARFAATRIEFDYRFWFIGAIFGVGFDLPSSIGSFAVYLALAAGRRMAHPQPRSVQ
ncbi:MAG TPA: hypothetical protein VHU82_07980 [Vicinamibacterales bacterium]|nr:hypothetical protein [Vicinamibacterales bacterium]